MSISGFDPPEVVWEKQQHARLVGFYLKRWKEEGETDEIRSARKLAVSQASRKIEEAKTEYWRKINTILDGMELKLPDYIKPFRR